MIFKKLIQLYAAVDYTKCACKHQVYSSEVHQLALFSSFYVEFSVQILVKTASIDNMFLVFFFNLFFFFVCQTWRIASLSFDATSSHAFCLLLCWATTDYIHYKLFIVFTEMCYWTALHAGHVWFLFFFVFFSFSVLEDVLFVGWLQHGIHTSFMASSLFWDSNKKVTGLPTPPPHTPPPCNLYKCISAVLKCTTIGCH